MGRWERDTWFWDLKWKEEWFAWESELVDNLYEMLTNVQLLRGEANSW